MKPGSSIIGISSIAGIRPAVRFAAYGAAKAGMNNLTETLSIELAPKEYAPMLYHGTSTN